jgi:hypothetical protein
MTGAVWHLWQDFQYDCAYWLPAWGQLEGPDILWQPIILGPIFGFGTFVLVVSAVHGIKQS